MWVWPQTRTLVEDPSSCPCIASRHSPPFLFDGNFWFILPAQRPIHVDTILSRAGRPHGPIQGFLELNFSTVSTSSNAYPLVQRNECTGESTRAPTVLRIGPERPTHDLLERVAEGHSEFGIKIHRPRGFARFWVGASCQLFFASFV